MRISNKILQLKNHPTSDSSPEIEKRLNLSECFKRVQPAGDNDTHGLNDLRS